MNAGFIKQINAAIAAIKKEMDDKRAGHPDSELSPERVNELLERLGMLLELLQQFDE